jgi:hypothetical protein
MLLAIGSGKYTFEEQQHEMQSEALATHLTEQSTRRSQMIADAATGATSSAAGAMPAAEQQQQQRRDWQWETRGGVPPNVEARRQSRQSWSQPAGERWEGYATQGRRSQSEWRPQQQAWPPTPEPKARPPTRVPKGL